MSQLNKQEQALIEAISKDCKTPAEASTKLKEMFSGLLENMLEAELDEHLGYEKHSAQGDGSGNSRNGHGRKTVKTEWGEAEISVPRDRIQRTMLCAKAFICPSRKSAASGQCPSVIGAVSSVNSAFSLRAGYPSNDKRHRRISAFGRATPSLHRQFGGKTT